MLPGADSHPDSVHDNQRKTVECSCCSILSRIWVQAFVEILAILLLVTSVETDIKMVDQVNAARKRHPTASSSFSAPSQDTDTSVSTPSPPSARLYTTTRHTIPLSGSRNRMSRHSLDILPPKVVSHELHGQRTSGQSQLPKLSLLAAAERLSSANTDHISCSCTVPLP